jgi:nucleoid DNA-binding protein
MNKTELINQVAPIVGTQKMAKEAVECVLNAIADALAENDTVQISGFGSFKVNQRKARTGRNPQTGAPMQIPAAKVPKFTPAKALKEAIQ